MQAKNIHAEITENSQGAIRVVMGRWRYIFAKANIFNSVAVVLNLPMQAHQSEIVLWFGGNTCNVVMHFVILFSIAYALAPNLQHGMNILPAQRLEMLANGRIIPRAQQALFGTPTRLLGAFGLPLPQ